MATESNLATQVVRPGNTMRQAGLQENSRVLCASNHAPGQGHSDKGSGMLDTAFDTFGHFKERLAGISEEDLNAIALDREQSFSMQEQLAELFRLSHLVFGAAKLYYYEKDDVWLAQVRSNSVNLVGASPSPTVAFRNLWVRFFEFVQGAKHDPDRIRKAIEDLETQGGDEKGLADRPQDLSKDIEKVNKLPEKNTDWGSTEHCGRFVARVSPSLHRWLSVFAEKEKLSLSDFCVRVIEEERTYIDQRLREDKGGTPRQEFYSFVKRRDDELYLKQPCSMSRVNLESKKGEFNLQVGSGLALKLLAMAAKAKKVSGNRPVTVSSILRFLLHMGVARRLNEADMSS